MRLIIAYSKIKKQNLVLINNGTYQRETLSERPIRQPLTNILPQKIQIRTSNSLQFFNNFQPLAQHSNYDF